MNVAWARCGGVLIICVKAVLVPVLCRAAGAYDDGVANVCVVYALSCSLAYQRWVLLLHCVI